jgi:hypothetical protein
MASRRSPWVVPRIFDWVRARSEVTLWAAQDARYGVTENREVGISFERYLAAPPTDRRLFANMLAKGHSCHSRELNAAENVIKPAFVNILRIVDKMD